MHWRWNTLKPVNMKSKNIFFENILTNTPEYIASYYHLAKLLEKLCENELAISWYKKGMDAAKAANDTHAYNELLAAYEDLTS